MKNVLFLTPMDPTGIGGGSFATHAYLRSISEILEGNVDILLADCWSRDMGRDINVDKIYVACKRPVLNTLMSVITGEIQRFSEPAKKIIKGNPNRYSFLVSNGSSISGNLVDIANRYGIKIVTIHHNYEPEYFRDNYTGLNKLLYMPHVKRLERNAYMNSALNIFLTQQDLEKFRKVYGECKGRCEVIGVYEYGDYVNQNVINKQNENITFVITGSLCTMQGIDGVKYFFSTLYSSLPADSKVIIAGRNPSPEIIDKCAEHSNVELVANPSDMSKVISSGDVYICPTRLGGGLKLRVMDGLKLGLPVITHSCSARGYDKMFETGCVKVFDTKEEFEQAVTEICNNMSRCKKEQIMEKYKSIFSYERGKQRMRFVLRELINMK